MSKEEFKKLWVGFIKSMKHRISGAHLSTYFSGSIPLEITPMGVLVIGVANAFIKETLEKKYGEYILDYFKSANKNIKTIKFKTLQIKKENLVDIPTALRTKQKKGAVKESQSISEKYNLDNYIVGDNNQLAYAAAKAVSKKPGSLYNPLFIYGGVGLGKTHLLQGIANAIRHNNPNFNVVYITAETFTNDLISAIGNRVAGRFRKKYRDNVDVLILDDIQFIEKKEKTQEELFHTFNMLYQAGRQLIFSSDRPPIELKTLEERLRSRFSSGMVADITVPDLETRIAILRSKIQARGLLVSGEVLNLIAECIDNNVRELEAVLNQVLDEAELLQKEIDIELVSKIVKRLFPTKIAALKTNSSIIDPTSIINIVAENFEITPNQIIGKSREKHITQARHLAMYLIRNILHTSLESIGMIFSNRNHTTVMHGVEKIKKSIQNNLSLVKIVNKIKRDLGFNV